MLGTINGTGLNLSDINDEGDLPGLEGDADIQAANAVASSTGVTATTGTHAQSAGLDTLAAAGKTFTTGDQDHNLQDDTLAAVGAAAVGAQHTHTASAQTFGSGTLAPIGATSAQGQMDDELSAEGEIEALRVTFIATQQAQTLQAAASVATTAALERIQANASATSSGASAIACALDQAEQDDQIKALFASFLTRKPIGGAATPHGAGSSLTPHGQGSELTLH